MASSKIALVGHCGPDAYMLRSSIKYALKDSDVSIINDSDALTEAIEGGTHVLLVNRVLEHGFGFHVGVDLIRDLKAKSPDLKLMLISDYPDAQVEAEKSGALPGFGKSQIGGAKMKEALAGLGE